MLRGAVAGRREIQLVRIGLQIGDEIGDIVRRHGRIDDQQIRNEGRHRDRREILPHIERQCFIQVRVGGERAACRHQQRVAVGIGLCDRIGADVAAGAAAIFDDHRLAEAFGERLRDNPGGDVGASPCGEADDHPDRLCRPGGLGMRLPQQHQRKRKRERNRTPHLQSSLCAGASYAPRLIHSRWSPVPIASERGSNSCFDAFS